MNGPHHQSGLAEGLDRALARRGSGSAVLDRELADLVELARRLDATASLVTPSDEFRARSRQRLLTHMARSTRPQHLSRISIADRVRVWAVRFAAAFAALSVGGAAAASASASALPGDPLYPVKQFTEAAALQLAPTDSARQDVILRQADTRLDETARLIQQGRDADAAATAMSYDDTLAALTASNSSDAVQSKLGVDEARLSELLDSAPAPARPGLQRALAVTARRLNRTRPTAPEATDQTIETAATPTPEPGQNGHPSVPADRESTEVRSLIPAEAGEPQRDHSAAHDAPATLRRGDVHRRADPTPVDIEPSVPASGGATDESDASPASDSPAAARGNPRPVTVQPGRTASEGSGGPRPSPTGRRRP